VLKYTGGTKAAHNKEKTQQSFKYQSPQTRTPEEHSTLQHVSLGFPFAKRTRFHHCSYAHIAM